MSKYTVIKEVPLSKMKLFIMLLGSIFFVVLGVFILFNNDNDFIAIICIVFFGLGALLFTYKLFQENKGLLIDSIGITIYFDANNTGVIAWEDIHTAEIGEIASTKMLLIFINNPDKYLTKVSPLQVRGLKNNLVLCGTPFVIPSGILTLSLKEIHTILMNEIQKRSNLNTFISQNTIT